MDVGFIGFAGAGKDTAALALIQRGWRRKAFADRLKDLAIHFGWNGEKDEKGRKLLQDLGMAARAYDPEFWIRHAENSIAHTPVEMSKIPYVWTDIRFENEAQFVRSRGGIIIRVVKKWKGKNDYHESEWNQIDIISDYLVVNNDTIEELHQKIHNIIDNHDKA